MNEKLLNKLIKKATKKTKFETDRGDWYHEDVFNKRKFAELIVRECMDQVKGIYVVPPDGAGCDEILREHFGVKND
jgi:hypothetical protein